MTDRTAVERAFCEAVERYAMGQWSPAAPGECTVRVRDKYYSMREISLLVRVDKEPLPEKTLVQLLQSMHAQHDWFRERLAESPLYSLGAQCLIALLDDHEAVYELREACRR